jgi:hypothetical protein
VPRPLEAPEFFVDHCLGTEVVADRLRRAGLTVHVLVDSGFTESTPDEEWLPVVAARGWVILTKDRRIGQRPLEKGAIVNSGAAAFVLVGGDMRGVAVAEAFAQAAPTMVRYAQKRARPLLATVSAAGHVAIKLGGARLGGVKRD